MYHQNLEAWKESIELVKSIYTISSKFPNSETYGLTNQIRRAAVSIPSNIAEGNARSTAKETGRFLDVALGSIAEVETQLIIAKELGYISEYTEELNLIKKVNALVMGLKNYFNERSE